MDSKPAPMHCMPPVDNPYPQQPPADQIYPPQQPGEQPNPSKQPADQLHPPQQPTEQPYFPQQPADQPYPPPGYQPGYTSYQYHAVQATVITQQPAYQQTSNTTVVVNQQVVPAQRTTRNWSSDLYGCCDDCDSLCMGLWCPYCLLIDVSSRMGEGCLFACCCPESALFGLRTRLRVLGNIEGSLIGDYCAVECCPLCVLCQLARELNHVGL